jgi:nitrate reductase gamma subunit
MLALVLYKALPLASLLVLTTALGCQLLRHRGRLHELLQAAIPSAEKGPLVAAGKSAAQAALATGLLRSDFKVWLGVASLRAALVLVALRHLRYFVYPVPGWLAAFQPVGVAAGYALAFCVGYLLLRRYLAGDGGGGACAPSCGRYPALLLLAAISATGLLMRLAFRPPLLDIKDMALGLVGLSRGAVFPDSHLFALHFLLVNALLIYLPSGKLPQATGVSFKKRLQEKAA